MPTHHLDAVRANLHGHFSRDLPPALTIDSGDTVVFRTLDARWGVEPFAPGNPTRKTFEPRDATRDAGHALTGPVAIRGAKAGMVLAVEIVAIEPGDFGFTMAGDDAAGLAKKFRAFGGNEIFCWELDAATGTATNQFGNTVAMRPFMGILGMPPAEPGIHSTRLPRLTGGNLDCREFVAGSTVFLPIAVDGALFSTGDGHAAQGDGEICGQAIECPMQRVEMNFTVREDLKIAAPCAVTPAGWVTCGIGETLDAATFMAMDAMLDVMGDVYGIDRRHALALASVVVNLRVTQFCNGTVGVHAVLPPDAVR